MFFFCVYDLLRILYDVFHYNNSVLLYASQLTVFLRDAILPSGTTFFILVDNGNGSKIELAFTLAKIGMLHLCTFYYAF